MKSFIMITMLLAIAPAHASYYRYVCSSADAEIRWEDSHGDTTIYFTYYDWEADEEKKVQFDVHDVNIKFLSKKTIKKIRSGSRCESSYDHHYYGQVRITPTPEIEAAFRKIYKTGKVTERLICHDHTSSESGNECE